MPNNRSPTIIYCTFLECIRQVNKDSLVRLNSEPVAETYANTLFHDCFTASNAARSSSSAIVSIHSSHLSSVSIIAN